MINADDMQSWAYLLAPTFQFVNTAGKPLTEGYIEVYIAGTRNKYYCASDFNGTLHPFQIPLDSLGANIVLADPDQAYDVYVYNKYGSLIMSRYHVSPGMTGGSGVLSITITSEDGTVSVTNDGNGNFDLSIQDTVDRIDALEQAVSGLSADSSVGYAIAHADTVNLDGTFNLINDSVSGIGYTSNMDGFRLKSGHIYQFNFNALFENGEFDRNCSGKLYLEGPDTIAQEWKFDLDDSYYHSQSFNGSTVLLTPRDLNYYDLKLKLAWDVDYPNKPNVDLNKISLVDITTLISTTVSGMGGDYTAGDGIYINDETNVISVDMDYINNHLNINVDEIVASAVNIATAYTDARVTTVSGDLVNLIAEVSASIPTGTVTQVQSDWNEQDSSSPAYIQHKPDLSVYATNASVSAVSSVLNERINDVSGAIPELPDEEAVEFEEIDLSDYALASAIPDVSDFVTHDEVSAVSGNIIEYVNSVSGDLVETINNVSGDIIHTVESVSGDIIETVNNVSGDIIHTVESVSGDIINTVETVSAVLEGDIVSAIQVATGVIPELPDEEEVEFEEVDLSDYALASAIPDISNLVTHDEFVSAVTAVSSMIPDDYVTHNEVSAVSSNLVNYVNTVSGDITNYVDESIVSAINVATGSFEQVQSDWTEDDNTDPAYIQNKPNEIELIAGQNIGIFSTDSTITIAASATDLSGYATHSEVNNVSGVLETEIQIVSAAIGEQVPNVSIQSPSGTLVVTETVSGNNKIYSIDVAPTSGIEYGQFYANNITGSATMARTKGNIDITNDGKIKLKQGQSYHVTVRGRYNQTVLKDNYSYASYIEYVTNNSININVDESRSGSQYFELSYDLFKLNSDTDYYVFFSLDDATVNDLFIEIHSLANVGSNGSSGGSSPEYDAGYGIQILNNVISVSGIAPQVQSDWNQTNTSSVDYIKNKPEEYGLLAGDNISITASGNNFIISAVVTGSPIISGYVTEAELAAVSGTLETEIQIVSASIPNVSGFATVELVSSVSGKLPTTELGKFTIHSNVSGGPIDVIVPTDQAPVSAFYNLNAQYDDSLSNRTGPSIYYYVFKSPGYDNDTWSANTGDVIQLKVKESIQGLGAIIGFYPPNSSPASTNGPTINYPSSSPLVAGTGATYVVDPGLYTIGLGSNPAGSSYGKYITLSINVGGSGLYVDDILDKIEFTIGRPNAAFGTIVNLNRYYLGNTNTTASNSGVQALIYTDPNTKQQTVYMPSSMPSNWKSDLAQAFEYDSRYNSPGAAYYDTKQYRAYKYTSSPRRYQFAYCTDWDYANKLMTFVAYDNSGNAIEKWTLDYTTYGSNVWTTTPISSGGTEYTAGDYIGITDDTISVTGITDLVAGDNITITASGSSAIISVSGAIQSQVSGASGIAVNDNVISLDNPIGLVAGTNVSIEVTGSSAIINATGGGTGDVTRAELISVSGTLETEIQTVSAAIPDTSNLASKSEVNAVSGTLHTEIVAISGAMVDVPTGVSGVVAGQGISITASGSDYVISCTVTGATSDVTMADLVSVSGTLEAQVQTVSSAIPTLPDEEAVDFEEVNLSDYALASAIPDVSNFVTEPTVSAIVDTALVDVPTGVSGLVAGTNVSITASGSNYVIDATVPDVSNLATKTELQTVSAAIPDTTDMATKTWVGNQGYITSVPANYVTNTELNGAVSGLATKTEVNAKQNTLTGITDVQVVQSLPASPVSTVLYLIPEV